MTPSAWRTAPSFYWYAVFANAVFQRGIFTLFLFDQGLSATQIGVLQALLYVSTGVAEIPSGIIADRVGRRASVVLGQLCIAIAITTQILADGSFLVFSALFILHAIGISCVSGADSALLYDWLRQRELTGVYIAVRSRYNALGAASMAGAIALGGVLQSVSWELVYGASGGAIALSAVILLTRVPEIRGTDMASYDAEDDPHGEGASLGATLRRIGPGLMLLVFVSGLMHATLTPYIISMQKAFSDQGAPGITISTIMATSFLLATIGPLLAEWANRVLGVHRLVPATLLVLTVAVSLTGAEHLWLTCAVFLVATSLPEITAVTIDNVFQESVPSRYRAGILSMVSFVESVLIGLGYLGLGMLTNALGASAGVAWYGLVPAFTLVLSLFLLASMKQVSGTEREAVGVDHEID